MSARTSIIQETEFQRQHARISLPAQIRILDKTYPVKDLSIGGLAAIADDFHADEQTSFPVTLILSFDGFRVHLDCLADIRHQTTGHLGLRFAGHQNIHTPLLRKLIQSFENGNFLTGDDILKTAWEGNIVHFPRQYYLEERGKSWPIWRKFLYASLIMILGFSALGFMGHNIYKAAFTLTSHEAYVSSEARQIKAGHHGIFKNDLKPDQRVVSEGEKIGEINNTAIISPCNCWIQQPLLQNGETVEPTSILTTLIPLKIKAQVKAYINPDDLLSIKLGMPADIKIAGTSYKATATVKFLSHLNVDGIPRTLATLDLKTILPVSLNGFPAIVTFYLRGQP